MSDVVDDGELEDMRAYAEDLESRILELTERNDRLLAQAAEAQLAAIDALEAQLAAIDALVMRWRERAFNASDDCLAGYADELEAVRRGETP